MKTQFVFLLLACLGLAASGEGFDHPFFPFKNSMESGGPKEVAEQVEILHEIGFDGFDNRNLADLEGTLKALDAKGMKLFSVYFTINIDPGEEAWNPALQEALPLLKGRGTVLWCNTHSKRFQPSDPAGDELAVPLFQQLADLVAPFGVRIAPYPHTGLWVESPEDTARLADKVNRPNFGTSFNLFHWKAMGDRKQPLDEVVKRLAPRLLLLSINGDVGPHNIGPLEKADIKEYCTVLNAFHDAGYRGPVGLQCYLIPGDPRVHLGQSFKVWRQLVGHLSKASPRIWHLRDWRKRVHRGGLTRPAPSLRHPSHGARRHPLHWKMHHPPHGGRHR